MARSGTSRVGAGRLSKLLATREWLDQGGWTVFGILVGMVLLAILAAIVASASDTTTTSKSVVGATRDASVVACAATVRTVQAAIEAYAAQAPTGNYPATLAVLTKKTTATPTNSSGPWLRQVPSAQVGKNGYALVYKAATGELTVVTKTTRLPGSTAAACKTA